MNTSITVHRRRCLSLVLPLILIAASATAQTVDTAEELREALKKELVPLSFSIQDQAKAVAAELAESVISELASTMRINAPSLQLARRDVTPNDKDPS